MLPLHAPLCPRRAASAVLGLALTSACGPTLIADGLVYYPPIGAAPEGDCRWSTERVEHLDEPTELGFSALEVLEHLAGEASSPLTWREPPRNEEYMLAYGPERGDSSLRLRVAAADGAILYRYSVPLAEAPEGTECEPARLEIPIEVTLQSGGHALDESFFTRLEASVPYRGSFSKTFEPGQLAGGLQFEKLISLDPERSFGLGPLTLDAVLWEGGSQGSLRARVMSTYAKESKALRPPAAPALEPGELALWPSAGQCDGPWQALPSDAKLIGFSARDVLGALQAAGDQELEWSDGSATRLSLQFEALEPNICQAFDDGLQFDAAVHVKTSDGRIDTGFAVRVSAAGESGSLGEISISRQGSAEPVDAAELEAMGSREDDLAAFGSILIELEANYRGRRGSGSIAVRGFDNPTTDGAAYASTVIQAGHWAR